MMMMMIIIIITIIIVIIIIIIIIISIIIYSVTVFAGFLFLHHPGGNNAPGASVTQVNHSVHTLSTFLRRSQHADLLGLCHSSLSLILS